MENKQQILDMLLPALQATSNLSDLEYLRYSEEREEVVATFANGWTKRANVAMDSGTAMIMDIVKQIV